MRCKTGVIDRRLLCSVVGLMACPAGALAAEGAGFNPSAWMVLPFGLLLLLIAVLPLVAGHFWHPNRNKAMIVGLVGLPVVGYLVWQGPGAQHALVHELSQYASFIILLAALYTVSGGIVLKGDIQATPVTNTIFLALGAVLANFIGTTGASVVLVRPVLRINRQRQQVRHLPIFFIFIVSNVGGLLTPLGDPPLFLGFLNGVGFFWTLSLWPPWLLVNGGLLALFLLWDIRAYRRETPAALARDLAEQTPLRVHGLFNLLFLAGILAAVLLQSATVGQGLAGWLSRFFPCPDLTLTFPSGELFMAAMAVLSLLATPRRFRKANAFSWGPIVEVAVLFAGIFVTMVPALEWLQLHGSEFGVTHPWQFFWLTGGLSSVLDNAPTYLTLAQLAASPHELGWLVENRPALLQAISCGAVFMGAMTYIGNGPNFMVKAIAEEAGFVLPSFFGYAAYSILILVPFFVLVTLVFFWPG